MGKKLDETLERAAAQFGPAGVQAVVIRNGRVVWSGKRGKAVIEPSKPVTDRTMFSYASLSKMMLTPFVLSQVENGALDLDKPISTYVGDDVAGSRVVTIRMLLTHTSGYPDLYGDPATQPLFPPGKQYDPNRPYTFEMLKAGIREPVDPGKRFEYSNTGFIVLGHVMSKISGGDEAFLRAYRNYIRRAGTPQVPMTEDQVTGERSQRALSRFAHGYTPLDNGTFEDFFTAYGATGIPTDLYGMPFTDGAFAGTATGAGLVLDALFARGQLLRPETVRQMITVTPQSGQTPDGSYGMGTYQTKSAGHTWQGHGGAYVGFNSMAGTDLTRGLTIVVVVNQLSDKAQADTIWRALTEAVS
nr:serine hydrolase domain-containing protein [Kibdelosporangium sp. MJ126-NF4]